MRGLSFLWKEKAPLNLEPPTLQSYDWKSDCYNTSALPQFHSVEHLEHTSTVLIR